MINLVNVKKFCNEHISLIENYDKAINDDTQTWDCHHKLGIELNLSKQQLKNNGLYYNRPASELIFLTPFEHKSLHNKGERNAMYGKNPEDFMPIETIKERRRKISEANKGKYVSEETKRKQSKSRKGKYTGELNPMYGKNVEDFMTPEAIKEKRRKQSESLKGENNGMYGKISPNRGRHRVYDNSEHTKYHYE